MKQLRSENSFDKGWKALNKKHYNKAKLEKVINLLLSGEPLPQKFKDHTLKGDWQGFRECHIEANWLLIYRTNEVELILTATGTHDDLFG